jgi:Lon protease-like protein
MAKNGPKKDGSIKLPKRVPVMPLPSVLLFPHALLPINIIEPPFQKMLELALKQHRMFCVALLKGARTKWSSTDDFFHIAGIGLIRACISHHDGTSSVVLQGLRRVRFSAFEQSNPFPIAHIVPLDSDATSSVETDALSAKVLELYSKRLPEKIDHYLSLLGNTEALADLIAATMVNDVLRRQRILEELTVNQRLRLLIKYLRDDSKEAEA